MKYYSILINDATVNGIINLLQYYTLSDFLQMDDLKKKITDDISSLLKKMSGNPPLPITQKNNRGAGLCLGKYACCGKDLDSHTTDEKHFREILEVFNSTFTYLKKNVALKYFDYFIKKYDCSNQSCRVIKGRDKNDISLYIKKNIQETSITKIQYCVGEGRTYLGKGKKLYMIDGSNNCYNLS